jgi:hypothetical protein
MYIYMCICGYIYVCMYNTDKKTDDITRRCAAIRRHCQQIVKQKMTIKNDVKKTDDTTGDVPRFGAIVSNMGARKEMVKASLFGGDVRDAGGGGAGPFGGGAPGGGPFAGAVGGGGGGRGHAS